MQCQRLLARQGNKRKLSTALSLAAWLAAPPVGQAGSAVPNDFALGQGSGECAEALLGNEGVVEIQKTQRLDGLQLLGAGVGNPCAIETQFGKRQGFEQHDSLIGDGGVVQIQMLKLI